MRKLITKFIAGLASRHSPSPLSLKAPYVALSLGLSLITPLYFGLVTLIYTTTSGPVIQDDARLHVVWLQRLVEPALFPQDAIAHYYTAIQSAGFQAAYGLAAALGIAPLTLAKILPLGLALIATGYLFWVALLILPVPLSGLLVTLVFNQNIWLKDDLASATPRAFVYPLFAAFLYYLMRDARGLGLLTLGLLGLFYPQMMLVALGMLTLRLLGQVRSPQRWRDGAFWLLALGLTAGLLLTFSHRTEAQVGPLVSLDEMLVMPEFQAGGRRPYFGVPLLGFAFAGASGLRLPLFPPIIGVGLLLPVLIWRRHWGSFQITEQASVLVQLLVAAMALFLLAHGVFPRLYLPSRYTFYSLRFLMAIASGLLLTLAVQQTSVWLARRSSPWTWRDRGRAYLGGALAIAIVVLPAIPAVFLPCHGWVVGQAPGLYEAIKAHPASSAPQSVAPSAGQGSKDTLVASLAPEINNVPAFAQRSVLVGEEFALPYHSVFYDLMQRRMTDLLAAQYSPEPADLTAFIQAYGIDLWLLDRRFAEPDYLMQQDWLINSAVGGEVAEVVRKLRLGLPLALAQSIPACNIFSEADLILLDAACIAKRAK
ncbi:MAG: hypothetical protein ACFB5Z_20670 [Elainellaceae cyanobacterium]